MLGSRRRALRLNAEARLAHRARNLHAAPGPRSAPELTDAERCETNKCPAEAPHAHGPLHVYGRRLLLHENNLRLRLRRAGCDILDGLDGGGGHGDAPLCVSCVHSLHKTAGRRAAGLAGDSASRRRRRQRAARCRCQHLPLLPVPWAARRRRRRRRRRGDHCRYWHWQGARARDLRACATASCPSASLQVLAASWRLLSAWHNGTFF